MKAEQKNLYIVRQREPLAWKTMNLRPVTFDETSRRRQIAEMVDIYQNDPANRKLQDWIHEKESAGVACISDINNNVTGTFVLDMSLENVAELEKKFGKLFIIIPDEPIELVRPCHNGTAPEVVNIDTWHLDSIKLKSARQSGFEYTGKGVTIAVLDTGIDTSRNVNVYDKVEEVLATLEDVATAIGALAVFKHACGLLASGLDPKRRLSAFMPGYHTAEKNALEAWEASVAKDGRRAVKLLFSDYYVQKAKLEALLAAEFTLTATADRVE